MIGLTVVSGLAPLFDKFGTILKERGRIVAAAVRIAYKPMLDAARAKCRRRTGTLANGLGMTVAIYQGGRMVFMAIGPMHGVKYPNGKAITRIAHMVENGTRNMAAQPFLRPAHDTMSGPCEALLAKTIGAML